MKKNVFLIFSLFVLALTSCDNDEDETTTAVAVAFVNQSANLSTQETQVNIVFSSPTTAAGSLTLSVEPTTNLTYGTDFTTNPTTTNGTIVVPFSANASSTTFTFSKLVDAIEGQIKNVKFTIASSTVSTISIPTETKFTQLNFNETAVTAAIATVENGGNTFPNGVYVDLSSGLNTAIGRTSWDLGFYSGSEFRVVLNPGINGFAVKQLTTTNIDEVQAEDASVTTGDYDPAGAGYIDNPTGELSGTSITSISATDADNKVYLVNLGQNVSDTPATGASASFTGTTRGWKKIRIVRSGNDYKLQYANIDATTHSEITISKNTTFNHTFFSFANNAIVTAEPIKEKWDLLLTPSIGYTNAGGNVSYYFGDTVLSNNLSGTKAYQVFTSEFTYENFNLANVVTTSFEASTANRRTIGTNWRVTYPSASVRTDRFYIVKDVAGNVYKLKFNALLSTSGTRGTTTFEYVKLN